MKRKLIAFGLATSLLLGASNMAFAKTSEVTGGGGVSWIDPDVVSVDLPQDGDAVAGFTLDPQGLASATVDGDGVYTVDDGKKGLIVGNNVMALSNTGKNDITLKATFLVEKDAADETTVILDKDGKVNGEGDAIADPSNADDKLNYVQFTANYHSEVLKTEDNLVGKSAELVTPENYTDGSGKTKFVPTGAEVFTDAGLTLQFKLEGDDGYVLKKGDGTSDLDGDGNNDTGFVWVKGANPVPTTQGFVIGGKCNQQADWSGYVTDAKGLGVKVIYSMESFKDSDIDTDGGESAHADTGFVKASALAAAGFADADLEVAEGADAVNTFDGGFNAYVLDPSYMSVNGTVLSGSAWTNGTFGSIDAATGTVTVKDYTINKYGVGPVVVKDTEGRTYTFTIARPVTP